MEHYWKKAKIKASVAKKKKKHWCHCYYQSEVWTVHIFIFYFLWVELKWLFNVTINDISVIYVTAHRCAGGLKKKLDLRSGSHAIDIS